MADDNDENSWKAHRLLILKELQTINQQLDRVLEKEERNGARLSRLETQIEDRTQDKRVAMAAGAAIVAAVVSALGAVASNIVRGH